MSIARHGVSSRRGSSVWWTKSTAKPFTISPQPKRGLDAGLAAGVFSIESHGWTHMLPDLEAPPGPFWDAPMDGVGSLDWYNEFGDALRKQEVPAVTQRLHLSRSIAYRRDDFGVVPLGIRPIGSR